MTLPNAVNSLSKNQDRYRWEITTRLHILPGIKVYSVAIVRPTD